MKIQRVDVVKVRLPLGRPYVISRGPTYHFQNLLVRIHGEDGLVGLGECADRTVITLRLPLTGKIVGATSTFREAAFCACPHAEASQTPSKQQKASGVV